MTPELVPEIKPKLSTEGLVSYFKELRRFTNETAETLTIDMIEQLERHRGFIFQRWERDCMFAMDRALRHSYSEVLKFHSKRSKIGLEKKKARR